MTSVASSKRKMTRCALHAEKLPLFSGLLRQSARSEAFSFREVSARQSKRQARPDLRSHAFSRSMQHASELHGGAICGADWSLAPQPRAWPKRMRDQLVW